MTGSSSSIRTLIRVSVFFGCIALPLAATTIATGTDVHTYNLTDDTLVYQVVTGHDSLVSSQGFIEPDSLIFTSPEWKMTLNNTLASGNVTSATLNLGVLWTVGGTLSSFSCSDAGTDCEGDRGHNKAPYAPGPVDLTPTPTKTLITVRSTNGTTYTWDSDVNPAYPFPLVLTGAFLTDLSNGADLDILLTRTFEVTGNYPNPAPSSHDKCQACTLEFEYDGLSSTTTINASIDATVQSPTAVPEPSTGIMVGLGLIVATSVLRRKFFPR